MSPFRPLILLGCSLALTLVTACAPPQPLSPRERQVETERLQRLKRELAELKEELAETRAREQQQAGAPAETPLQAPAAPVWFSWTGSRPVPDGYAHHATLLAGKQANPDSVSRVMALVKSLPTDPATPVHAQTLFIVPALDLASHNASGEGHDRQKSEELLREWPDSATDAGPYLLIEPKAHISGAAGRLLVDLNGLVASDLEHLLRSLQSLPDGDATDVLTTLLRERQGVPASVTSFGDDFSIGWPK